MSESRATASRQFATIVADPPWKVMAGPLNGREGFGDATGASRPLAYPSMTVEAIAALREIIENAPHADYCGAASSSGPDVYECRCWKADAEKAMERSETPLPEEPTHAMLKALAGDPAILAASDEAELRLRYAAMLAAMRSSER